MRRNVYRKDLIVTLVVSYVLRRLVVLACMRWSLVYLCLMCTC